MSPGFALIAKAGTAGTRGSRRASRSWPRCPFRGRRRGSRGPQDRRCGRLYLCCPRRSCRLPVPHSAGEWPRSCRPLRCRAATRTERPGTGLRRPLRVRTGDELYAYTPLFAGQRLFGTNSFGKVYGATRLVAMIDAATGPWPGGFLFDRLGGYDGAFATFAAVFAFPAATGTLAHSSTQIVGTGNLKKLLPRASLGAATRVPGSRTSGSGFRGR